MGGCVCSTPSDSKRRRSSGNATLGFRPQFRPVDAPSRRRSRTVSILDPPGHVAEASSPGEEVTTTPTTTAASTELCLPTSIPRGDGRSQPFRLLSTDDAVCEGVSTTEDDAVFWKRVILAGGIQNDNPQLRQKLMASTLW